MEAFFVRRIVFVDSTGFGLSSRLKMIAIGSSSDEFVRDVLNLSDRYDIETMISNHEHYLTEGEIALGEEPQAQLDRLFDDSSSSSKKAS